MAGLQWVVDGYTLMFAALLLTAGSVSDRVGARRAFCTGMVVFVVASIACGLAPALPALIGARFVRPTNHNTPAPSRTEVVMNQEQSAGWTGGARAFGDFAPGMVHYADKVLFDEVWERDGLSKRDRSLITVAALTAMGKTDQLTFHLDYARSNGMSAMAVAKQVFGD